MLRYTVKECAIRSWMRANLKRFRDECGNVNTTALVEAWDVECSSGEATLDTEHPAWDIAVIVSPPPRELSGLFSLAALGVSK